MQKHFLNLTNGIEALAKYDLNLDDVQFVRIQSTHLENESFDKMLATLDSNFLMWLALGCECIIYDFGAKSETSKAIYYGVEWIKYVLNLRWFNKLTIPFVKQANVSKQFVSHYKLLTKKTKKQLDYYKKFLLSPELHITTITAATQHDNQPDFFLDIIKSHYNC